MGLSGNTDCHTSDVGHWFAMTYTDFVCSLRRRAEALRFLFRILFRPQATSHLYFSTLYRGTKGRRIGTVLTYF